MEQNYTSLCRYPSWPSSSSTWHATSSIGFGFSHGFSVFREEIRISWMKYRKNLDVDQSTYIFVKHSRHHAHWTFRIYYLRGNKNNWYLYMYISTKKVKENIYKSKALPLNHRHVIISLTRFHRRRVRRQWLFTNISKSLTTTSTHYRSCVLQYIITILIIYAWLLHLRALIA